MIFEDIVHHQGGVTSAIEGDLGLLSTLATYFASMGAKMGKLAVVCSRLQHVAATFLQLAQVHVNNVSTVSARRSAQSVQAPVIWRDNPRDTRKSSAANNPAANSTSVDNLPSREAVSSLQIGDIDIANYFEWLPADMDTDLSIFGMDQSPSTTLVPDASNNSPQMDDAAGRQGAFGSTFDWFSWDAYYGGVEQQGVL